MVERNRWNRSSRPPVDPPTNPAQVIEGFNTVVGTSTSITSGIPTDWTFLSGLAVYTTSGYYGVSAPSRKFQATGHQMTTPALLYQQQVH